MSLPAHCPDCGGPTEATARNVAVCSRCGRPSYANPKPAAGVLLERGGRLLLVRRGAEPSKGKWDVPGGYLEEGETPEEGARRELGEELGVEASSLTLAFTEHNPLADHVVLDILFEAVLADGTDPRPADDVAACQWFRPDQLPRDDLAFAATPRILDRWRHRRAGGGDLRLLGGDELRLGADRVVASAGPDWPGLPDGWRPECGDWRIHDRALCGQVEGERPAVLWLPGDVSGDHAIRFRAWTVPPHGNDINCFWEGAGRIEGSGDVACTIAGFGGWWSGLTGLERYPEERGLRATGRTLTLVPGRAYEVIAGRCGQADFLFVDGRLAVQLDDPAARRRDRSRLALATWNSHVHCERVAAYRLG